MHARAFLIFNYALYGMCHETILRKLRKKLYEELNKGADNPFYVCKKCNTILQEEILKLLNFSRRIFYSGKSRAMK